MWNFFRTKDLGKVLYDLTIDIGCGRTVFEKTPLHSIEDTIEMYGLAINRAKMYLKGNWKIIEGGYLVRGFARDVPRHTAILDIEENILGLAILHKIFTSKEKPKKITCEVCLHFKDGGGVMKVGINERGMYIH